MLNINKKTALTADRYQIQSVTTSNQSQNQEAFQTNHCITPQAHLDDLQALDFQQKVSNRQTNFFRFVMK